MRRNITISLDEEVVKRSKVVAGLVPFSRHVEHLLRQDLLKREEKGRDVVRGKGHSDRREDP